MRPRARACVAILAGLIASGAAAQQQPLQLSLAPRSPVWVTETTTDLVFLGAADGTTETQAKSGSYDNAAYRGATEIARRVFAQQNAPLSMSLESLSAYVKRVSRVLAQERQPARLGYQGTTRLQFNKAFLDPLTIAKLTPPAPTAADAVAVGYLLLPPSLGKPGTVTARAQVRAPNASNGNFVFTFSIRQAGGGVAIRLDNVEVIEDGSVGATRWAFDVSLNGRKAFSVPVNLYDDRVRQYPTPTNTRQFEVSVTGAEPYIEIKVAGTRPQSLK